MCIRDRSNIAKCQLQLKQLRLSVDTVKQAVLLDSNNDKLFRFGGIVAFKDFKISQDPEMIFLADDFMRNAFEINPNKINVFNYLLIRKAVHLFKQNQKFLEKDELVYFLKKNNDLKAETLKDFLKPTYFDSKKEIPDFLTCSITLEVIREAVTTPSGYSYEKQDIVEWCQNSGCKDVMTNKSFGSLDNLVPNYLLQKFIKKYLKKNPWAIDTGEWGDDLTLYEFRV